MRKPTQGVTCPESHSYCIWNYLTDSDLYFYSLGNPFYRTFYHLEHRFWYLGSCIVPLKPYLPTLTLLWDLLRPLPISQPSQFSSFCGLQSHFCFLFPTFSVHLGLPFCSHFITSLQITSIQPSLPSLSPLSYSHNFASWLHFKWISSCPAPSMLIMSWLIPLWLPFCPLPWLFQSFYTFFYLHNPSSLRGQWILPRVLLKTEFIRRNFP